MGSDAKGIDDAVFEFATIANDHMITARDFFKEGGVPDEAMPVFLTGASSFNPCQTFSPADTNSVGSRRIVSIAIRSC